MSYGLVSLNFSNNIVFHKQLEHLMRHQGSEGEVRPGWKDTYEAGMVEGVKASVLRLARRDAKNFYSLPKNLL
jgi:hypothetical protein